MAKDSKQAARHQSQPGARSYQESLVAANPGNALYWLSAIKDRLVPSDTVVPSKYLHVLRVLFSMGNSWERTWR